MTKTKFHFNMLWVMLFLVTAMMGFSATSVSAANIPEGAGQYRGHYYYVFPNNTCSSYNAAEAYCESLGGHLAVITSAAEDAYLYQYMTECGYGMAFFGFYNAGKWKWVDGTAGDYTNWNTGEPEGEPYARYKNHMGGVWVDDSWGGWDNTTFICEWDGAGEDYASIKLNKTSIVLVKGKTCQLKLIGTNKKPKWKTAKKSIASISAKGKVKARRAGTTKVSAILNGKKYYCKVKVEAPKLNKKKLSLKVGAKSTLKLKGTRQKVTWKSSKPSVVTVSQQGVVTAKKNGKARIVAKAGGVKFKCTVKVRKAASANQQTTTTKHSAEELKKRIAAYLTKYKSNCTVQGKETEHNGNYVWTVYWRGSGTSGMSLAGMATVNPYTCACTFESAWDSSQKENWKI